MDAELEFAIQSSTTGKELFEQVRIMSLFLGKKLLRFQMCFVLNLLLNFFCCLISYLMFSEIFVFNFVRFKT